MRASWVLFFVIIFLLWLLWDVLTPLRQVSLIIGSVWVALQLSYRLSRFIAKHTWVRRVRGNGKAVLITGCDTGFGHRLAKRLSRKGFLVFAGCLSSKSDGAEALKCLSNVKVLQMDVTKQEQVDDALDVVKEHLGDRVLWSVVANAGIGSGGLLEWTSLDTVAKIFDVNVFGVLRIIKMFLPLLRKSKGRVVTLASPLGRFTAPMTAPYCMSKYAVISMMDAFRRECYGKGVDFITVEPSAYRTSIVTMFNPPKDQVMREFRKQAPDVIADYSEEEIVEWLRMTAELSKTLIRQDPEECVDVIESAVTETHPTIRYRSPWGSDYSFLLLLTSVPAEVADIIVSLTRRIQIKML
ncbi:D-beta-hydroxybutyrate dehydrogenase, mitochondrial-like [Amblyomma americanum]